MADTRCVAKISAAHRLSRAPFPDDGITYYRCSRNAVPLLDGTTYPMVDHQLCRQHYNALMRPFGVVTHYESGRRLEKGVK